MSSKTAAPDSPVINPPRAEPQCHWSRRRDGSSALIAETKPAPGRRPATGRLPNRIGEFKPRNTVRSTGDLGDPEPHLEMVNDIRKLVKSWQSEKFPHATPKTKTLLCHWTDEERRHGLYYAQLEAVLTSIWLHEAAPKTPPGQAVLAELDQIAANANQGLLRIAHRMATGAGKTAVIAALMLWQTANSLERPRDERYTRNFLCLTPGLTVRDRLDDGLSPRRRGRVNRNAEFHKAILDLTPPDLADVPDRIQVKAINWQQFVPKDRQADTPVRARQLARQNPDTENVADAVTRVLGPVRGQTPYAVFNDEAHHCHRGAPNADQENHDGYIWYRALQEMKRQGLILEPVRDLSATPAYIAAGNAPLFPWIVSQFDLPEAEAAGIVKIMRLPTLAGTRPEAAADLYGHSPVPARRRLTATEDHDPNGGRELKAALKSVCEDWDRLRQSPRWQREPAPPAIAVVVNSIANAKAIHRYIAGGPDADGIIRPGALSPELSNYRTADNRPHDPPRTIIVHSQVDRPGDAEDAKTDPAIKIQAAAYRKRYPEHQDRDGLPLIRASDRAVIRAVLNTVGQPGQPGEQVRCVVSVGMLTEGWDARNVTHLVGFRRFGTQLLCEQVAGRALRRVAHDDADPENCLLPAEYADLLGVPYPGLRQITATTEQERNTPPPPPAVTVAVAADRMPDLDLRWPNIIGYKRPATPLAPPARLRAPEQGWTEVPALTMPALSPQDPLAVTAPQAPAGAEHEMAAVGPCRQQEFLFLAARDTAALAAGEIAADGDANQSAGKSILFRDALTLFRAAARQGKLDGPEPDAAEWPGRYTEHPGRAARWLLEHAAADSASVATTPAIAAATGEPIWLEASRLETYRSNRRWQITGCVKSLTENIVCDSHWEVLTAQALDQNPAVRAWARNERLGWTVPYRDADGQRRRYEPDFLAALTPREGDPDRREIMLLIEVKGQEQADDADKERWTRDYWLPAVNAHAEFGRDQRWAWARVDQEPVHTALDRAVNATLDQAGETA